MPTTVTCLSLPSGRPQAATPSLLHPPPPAGGPLEVPATVCKAAVQVAADLRARVIVVFTQTGATARFVSRFRPRAPIVGLTPHERTRRRMALYWGVRALPSIAHTDDMAVMAAQTDERIRASGLAGDGDLAVVVAGNPGRRAMTNRVIVHRLGEPDVTHPPG